MKTRAAVRGATLTLGTLGPSYSGGGALKAPPNPNGPIFTFEYLFKEAVSGKKLPDREKALLIPFQILVVSRSRPVSRSSSQY